MIRLALDRSIFEYDGRGIASVTRNFYKELMRLHGREIELFTICNRPLVSAFDLPACEIRCEDNPDVAWQSGLAKAVARTGVDVVHFPFNVNFSESWRKELPAQTKIVSTIHDMIPFVLPEMHHVTLDWLRRREVDIRRHLDESSIVFTASESAKADLVRIVGARPEKVEVLYNAASLDLASADAPKLLAGDYFLYNGGYDYRKGMQELVDAFLQLKMVGRLRESLVLTGAPVPLSPRFTALVEYGKSHGWIRELGYVSNADLAVLFAHARALVYLSAYEGFGLPPLEAMRQGCPVITCRNSSIPEVCGEAVCYVDRADSRQVQEALLRLSDDESYRRELIDSGRQQSQLFSWEKTAERFYRRIVSGVTN